MAVVDCFTVPSYELVIPVYEVGEAVYGSCGSNRLTSGNELTLDSLRTGS